jgi:predicted phosphodiesterase
VRVAALHDVHGNAPALEAVLSELDREAPDARVVIGGDVALGPMPTDCLAALLELGERALWLRGNCERELPRLPAVGRGDRDARYARASAATGRGRRERAGRRPRAHTRPFDRRVVGKRLVNAGSVGMPYEVEPGAYWALLGPDVELRRTSYDLAEAARRIRASGFPRADELADENVLTCPSADEATAHFERLAQTRCAGRDDG